MKKPNLFALGLLSVLCASALNAQAADTGTINFTGNIVENTCAVTVDGQGADATVALPDVMAATLNADHQAGLTNFDLKISGCTGVDGSSSVAATFDSGDNALNSYDETNFAVTAMGGVMKNTASDGAKNVYLMLVDSDNTPISVTATPVHGETQAPVALSYVNITEEGNATIPMGVEYTIDNNNNVATAGAVTGVTTYQLVYK
ncbi:MAG TPA: fimbrial protein [Buttiauxella sp.]